MDKYINRDLFLDSKRHLYCESCAKRKNGNGKIVYEIGDAPCRACGIGDVLDDVEDFPAADVRPVVRCRDCKHRDPEDRKCDCGGLEHTHMFPVADDWFCADGEKREVEYD